VFAVPVKIQDGNSFTLGDGSPVSRIKKYSLSSLPARRVPPQSCIDLTAKAVGLTESDQITGVTPPAGLGNLSLNAYPADTDVVNFHFCNSSTSEALSPVGTYSFLAIR
jgi:hypothetical protein